MIKLLLFGKQLLLFIIIAWSLLAFVSYNVLTVEATIEEKDIREMEFVNDDNDDYGLKAIAIEQECKDNDGQWTDGTWCKFDKDKTEDEKKFENQLEDRGLMYLYQDKESGSDEWEKYQEEKSVEKAAKEDAICDNEDADTTDIKLCMSEQRILIEQSDKINEKICDKVDGKWTNDGCETDHDGPKADRFHELQNETPGAIVYDRSSNEEEPVIEDYGNTVSGSETDNESIDQQEYFEARAESNSNSENIHEVAEEIVEEEESEQEEEPEQEEEQQEDEPEEEDDNSDSESEE